MDEGSRKTALVIGAVVTAASVAIASYYYVKMRSAGDRESQPLRTVTEVLNECYAKMREIQEHLSGLNPSALKSGTS